MSPFEDVLDIGTDCVDKVLPKGFLVIGEALRSDKESLDSSR